MSGINAPPIALVFKVKKFDYLKLQSYSQHNQRNAEKQNNSI